MQQICKEIIFQFEINLQERWSLYEPRSSRLRFPHKQVGRVISVPKLAWSVRVGGAGEEEEGEAHVRRVRRQRDISRRLRRYLRAQLVVPWTSCPWPLYVFPQTERPNGHWSCCGMYLFYVPHLLAQFWEICPVPNILGAKTIGYWLYKRILKFTLRCIPQFKGSV